MSILGAVVRSRSIDEQTVAARLASLPGVDIAANPHDGRFVVVLEDVCATPRSVAISAAVTLAQVAAWPEVHNVSLVYEYGGPDAPPVVDEHIADFAAWRTPPRAA